jgi:glycogen debranching enzyme
MSRDERIFNPLSYHRGSVWPHDNSLIAHGMALYEFREPANRLFTTLFQAALNSATIACRSCFAALNGASMTRR